MPVAGKPQDKTDGNRSSPGESSNDKCRGLLVG